MKRYYVFLIALIGLMWSGLAHAHTDSAQAVHSHTDHLSWLLLVGLAIGAVCAVWDRCRP